MITLLALVGMPGSGKTTVSSYLHSRWKIPTYYIGSILVQKCREAGIEPTYSNRMQIGQELGILTRDDPLSLLRNSYTDLRKTHTNPGLVVIDSVRTCSEVQFLKSREPGLAVLAVLLGRKMRHERLSIRDHSSIDQIEHRDDFEIGRSGDYNRRFEVGNVIALADYYFLAHDERIGGNSLHEQLDAFIGSIA